MSSNRKNKKNNKKKNHHVLNSYTMEALEPRLMMAADLGAAFNELRAPLKVHFQKLNCNAS